MSSFRDVLIGRQARGLRRALAVLAAVTRHDDDPHAVRITLTTADGQQPLGSLCLGVIALSELVDAARTRAADIAREQPAPSAPVLRLLQDGGDQR